MRVKDKRRLFLVLGLVFAGLCLVLGIVAVVVAIKVLIPKLRERVVGEARARGIELGFEDVEVSWNHLAVERARFRLVGVRGLAGTVERIDISTSGFEPTGIHLEQLHLELLGSVPSVALELSEWTKNFPEAYALPLRADPVSVRWRTAAQEEPWLVLNGGQVGRTVKGGNFLAKAAQIAGITVGPIHASWTKTSGSVELGFGEQTPTQAPVTIAVDYAKAKPTAAIRLKPTAAEKLAAPLGVKLPVEGVTVSSEVELEFQDRHGQGPVTGALAVTLDGYIPPHPPELDGFVFGKATTFHSKLGISEDRKTVELTESRVKAGAFELKGKGVIQRHADHARARLEFTGFLSCVSLAGAAAETHLGQVLSKLPKLVAKQTLQGSVGVTVKIDADTRDLENAKVLRLIGIGCGLKPLRPPTPEELAAFAKELPEFLGELPSLADKLPLPGGLPLPSGLPLPAGSFTPPKLPLPTIEFERAAPKQQSQRKAE